MFFFIKDMQRYANAITLKCIFDQISKVLSQFKSLHSFARNVVHQPFVKLII